MLASTVQLARQLLADYPGESTLHGIVCGKLMTALTRHTRTCGALAGVPEWAAFVGAFAANEPPFAHLPGKLHRKLACCALQAASGLGEAEARGAYLAGLAGPVGAGLAALGGRRLGEGDVQGSGGSQMLLMVERLCGFCQGMEPSMHERLWGLLQPHLGVLLEVQRAAAVNTGERWWASAGVDRDRDAWRVVRGTWHAERCMCLRRCLLGHHAALPPRSPARPPAQAGGADRGGPRGVPVRRGRSHAGAMGAGRGGRVSHPRGGRRGACRCMSGLLCAVLRVVDVTATPLRVTLSAYGPA